VTRAVTGVSTGRERRDFSRTRACRRQVGCATHHSEVKGREIIRMLRVKPDGDRCAGRRVVAQEAAHIGGSYHADAWRVDGGGAVVVVNVQVEDKATCVEFPWIGVAGGYGYAISRYPIGNDETERGPRHYLDSSRIEDLKLDLILPCGGGNA